MNKGGKFSVYEGVLFITVIIVSKILYTSTPIVVKQTGTAAWYSTLISCVTTIIFFLLVCMLGDILPLNCVYCILFINKNLLPEL